jgi:hypothetical protein
MLRTDHLKKKILYFILAISLVAGFYFSIIKPEKKYRILVLWTGAGEREWAKRLEIACNNLKWECRTAFYPQELSSLERSLFLDCIPSSSIDQVVEEFKPDFAISLSKRCQHISLDTKKYLAISGDSKTVFNVICPHPEEFLEFDGLLHASPLIKKIKDFVESSGNTFQGIDWYPSCPATRYEPTVPKRLFYCGFQWDQKRNGAEYQKMFSLLDQQGYLDVYGPPEKWGYAPNSRKGYLPFDGKSVSGAIRKSGVALVLHAQSHLDLEAPTSRIFEAASSCSVIISDRNPFVAREFGESVLYIDGDLNGEELFLQIDGHMKWILSHPEEAQEMAQKAHAIFLEKFTLERQMGNLIKMHKSLRR